MGKKKKEKSAITTAADSIRSAFSFRSRDEPKEVANKPQEPAKKKSRGAASAFSAAIGRRRARRKKK